jgi:hypothetical protein
VNQMRWLKVGLIAAGVLAGLSGMAHAIAPAEKRTARYATMPLPHCGAADVLAYVSGRFASRETTYWNTGLSIGSFDRIHERGLRPWGPNFVPRRFCGARAHFNDGRVRHVSYFVRERIGAFGNTWEVIWCVTGLDRHRTYAPNCEQAGPW